MKVGMLCPHDTARLPRVRPRPRGGPRRRGEAAVPRARACATRCTARADAPRIVGKRDATAARPLEPPTRSRSASPSALARAVDLDSIARPRRRHRGPPARSRASGVVPLARTPFFCSGCPHNTSTAQPRRDAARRRHRLPHDGPALARGQGRGHRHHADGRRGRAVRRHASRSPTPTHFVQNLGDGTFHHSGSLAIRSAVAAGTNVTYKLLYNDTVAMTGGQDVLGQLKVPELTRWLALEGVKRIIVTTEDPRRYRGVELDPIATVRHRDELADAQAELAADRGRHRAASTTRAAPPRSAACASAASWPTPGRAHPHQRARVRGLRRLRREVLVPVACCRSRPSSAARPRSTRRRATATSRASKGDCPSFLRSSRARARRRRPRRRRRPSCPSPCLRVPRHDFARPHARRRRHRRGDRLADPPDGGAARRQARLRPRPDRPGPEGRPGGQRRAHLARPHRGLEQGRRPARPTCCSASTSSARRTRRTCSVADAGADGRGASTPPRCRPRRWSPTRR